MTETTRSAVPTSPDGTFQTAHAVGLVSGGVQPRGVLLAVQADDGLVAHASTGVQDHLGVPVEDVLGAPLAAAIGEVAARRVLERMAHVGDLGSAEPLAVNVPDLGIFDVLLHRIQDPRGVSSDGDPRAPLVVVELEQATGSRPLTVPATFGVVRSALREMDKARTLDELFDIAARAVRDLTGFDRVAVHRFDPHFNAEVVADAHREDLASAVGVHFPSSDLPDSLRRHYLARRSLYVSDLAAEPAPVIAADPTSGPLDLTAAVLAIPDPQQAAVYRSRGLSAVLSIGLLHGGKLWGIVKCHNYTEPIRVPYEARLAVELVGSTLAALSAAQIGRDRQAEARRQERVLAHLAADSRDESAPLGIALTRTGWTRRLTAADGAMVFAEGKLITVGHVPPEAGQQAIIAWVTASDDEIVVTDCLREAAPEVAALAPDVAGVMGITLHDDQVVIWLRDEVQRRVEWGGDPTESRPVRADDPIRRMLRASHRRWREVVDGHSLPWTEDQVDSALALRGHLVEALYVRGRKELRATEELQRSLLPPALPIAEGWTVHERYEAAGAGLVGGDWYDALVLPSGKIALVVGDVTGHGLQAAATMGQLSTALRASLVTTCSVTDSVRSLLEVARWTLPTEVATLTVAIVDPATGVVENVSLGHPPLLVVHPDGATEWAGRAKAPPLGVTRRIPEPFQVEVPPGGALVLYSDGLVERREEAIGAGLARLADAFPDGARTDVDEVVRRTRDQRSTDDATLLVLHRSAVEA